MNEQTVPGAVAPLPAGRFEGRADFQRLVRESLACAASEGWPELILADAHFADWPLGERSTEASLLAWSKSGRRIVLLARRFDELVRRHPRFVSWRRRWSPIIECRACRQADPLEFPSAIWSPRWVLQRLDPERCTGITGSEPARRLALRELLLEWQHRSTPSFPADTLGL